MRRHYIDNLRWMTVLLLFVYHTFMIYNSFGEGFYIKGASVSQTTWLIIVTWPWFMPLLFTIAGISSALALQKRSFWQYAKERALRLLIPLIAGVLLLVPAQTYFAERFHNGYSGGYFEQYLLFFTKPTDFTGYTGGFTPGHLWFILYLFIISMLALPIMRAYRKSAKKLPLDKLSLPLLLALFLLPLLCTPILNIGGKSLGEYFAFFMLGYFVLASESVLEKLGKRILWLAAIAAASLFVMVLGWSGALPGVPAIASDIFSRFYAWAMILALLGLGRRFLNFSNRVTDYLSKSSFAVYVFHQSWIIAIAYYAFQLTGSALAQICIILPASVAATFVTYALCKRLRVTRLLFGVKP